MTVAADDPKPGSTGDGEETDPNLSSEHQKTPEFIPPTDGSWVPRGRLNNLNAKVDQLTEQLEQEKKQNAPKPVSREKLLAQVDAGEISQAEADAVSEQQLETRVADQVETVIKDTAAATKMQQELSKYEENVPELNDEASELYGKVASEYRYMTKTLGMPDTLGTTLAAVRSVVGPAKSLKKIELKENKGENHEENSSGGGSGNENSSSSKVQLSARQKDHYRNAIRMGAYASWDAVYKELEEYGS